MSFMNKLHTNETRIYVKPYTLSQRIYKLQTQTKVLLKLKDHGLVKLTYKVVPNSFGTTLNNDRDLLKCKYKVILELLGFLTLSIVRLKKQRFRNCVLFRPQVRGWETSTLLGPLEGTKLNH
jgi:hypothetical protein